MLKRKVYDDLLAWKQSPSQRAVLLTGARQIGKTYIARAFAKAEYESLIELNFLLDPDAKNLFVNPSGPNDLMMRLSLFATKPIVSGKTLVLLDEIQEAPEALTSIKGLVEQGKCDFILTGSLLGVQLKEIRSNPVGFVQTIEMFPLDFEEFCWAQGVESCVFATLRDNFSAYSAVDDFIHERIMRLFRQYLVIGGMPDAVQTFIQTQDILAVREIQESIKNWYRTDIAKYCPVGQRLKAVEAFDLVPAELNNQNKRFVLKNLNEGARFRNYEDAFLWLTYANVALAVFNVEEPVSPLLINKQRNLFKLFYSDTGLLTSCFSNKTALALLDNNAQINFGSVHENAIAQELKAHGHTLYYFNSKKHGEVDFVIESRDGQIIPIEVKSGKSYKRHRALSNILEVQNWDIDYGYVLGYANVEIKEGIIYLPIYMVAFL